MLQILSLNFKRLMSDPAKPKILIQLSFQYVTYVAPFWHGLLSHSLMLISQIVPSNPGAHLHSNWFSPLSQLAPFRHGLLLHSSISTQLNGSPKKKNQKRWHPKMLGVTHQVQYFLATKFLIFLQFRKIISYIHNQRTAYIIANDKLHYPKTRIRVKQNTVPITYCTLRIDILTVISGFTDAGEGIYTVLTNSEGIFTCGRGAVIYVHFTIWPSKALQSGH